MFSCPHALTRVRLPLRFLAFRGLLINSILTLQLIQLVCIRNLICNVQFYSLKMVRVNGSGPKAYV